MPENGQKIQKMLERLYPEENCKRKYREYRLLQKRLVLVLILSGVGVCICSSLWGLTNTATQEEAGLLRREWGEGSYEVTLSAQIGEDKEKITYVVCERQYTDEELQQLLSKLTETLPELIKGRNESLLYVSTDLELPGQVQGYPFTISWKSSNYQLLRTDGRVNTKEIPKQGEGVVLTAHLTYDGQTFQKEFDIKLCREQETADARTQRAGLLRELVEKSDELSKQEHRIPLPGQLGTETIVWRQQKPWQGGYFLLLGVLAGGAVVWGMNRDLAEKDKERKKHLTAVYPEFVSSLQLYLGAGLSLRNAFFRIGEDYQIQKQKDGKKQFLYEEIVLACNRLANGIPEPEVYRKWAERCDEVHYRKLGYLLVSYGRQGNSDILRQLGKEVCDAWEERRQASRKQGEEAGTKLLFPMVIMLLVVMLLILLPVYMNF